MDFFESAYHGIPPWDIGKPQQEFIRLAALGEITGDVLDVGCGTGENALYLATLGHTVWGIDSAPTAIEKARQKAKERGIDAHFLVRDALNLNQIEKTFDTVIDSGLFHSLSDLERPCFVRNLADVLNSGATYFMLCFSDREPGGYGPRRITKGEIRDAFVDGWHINYIRPAIFENRIRPEGAKAWLASITRNRYSCPVSVLDTRGMNTGPADTDAGPHGRLESDHPAKSIYQISHHPVHGGRG